MKKTLLIPVLLLLGGSSMAQTAPAPAQTTPAQTAPAEAAPLPVKNPISSALREVLPNRQKNTIAAVEAMPADKFNYKPTPEQVTFGHLVAHMIGANNAVVQQCRRRTRSQDRRSERH